MVAFNYKEIKVFVTRMKGTSMEFIMKMREKIRDRIDKPHRRVGVVLNSNIVNLPAATSAQYFVADLTVHREAVVA